MKNLWILPLAMVATIACAKEKPASGDRTVISDGWKLSREGVAMHYDAPVPSTVAGVLSEAGVFGDALLESRHVVLVADLIEGGRSERERGFGQKRIFHST